MRSVSMADASEDRGSIGDQAALWWVGQSIKNSHETPGFAPSMVGNQQLIAPAASAVVATKHVCIASIGHSGSTLLSMLLDQHPDIASIGELKNVALYAGDQNRRCGCGVAVANCDFWRQVELQLRESLQQPRLNLAEFAQPPNPKRKALHRPVGLLDVLLVYGGPALWKLGASLSADVRREWEYGIRGLSLYNAVAAVRNVPVVVDSPTTATYTKAMFLADSSNFRAVSLVRDGRGWCYSLMRRECVSMNYAVSLWCRRQRNMRLALSSIPEEQRINVQYEKLCREPAETLQRICAFLQLPNHSFDGSLKKATFHGVGGNPMRFKYDETAIHLDEKWRTALSADDLALYMRLAGKLHAGLGYAN